ncbi:uncharacterized protein LOC110639020 isoform X2 [Hevea brasiliensis]|uniref:uncharacterized protein LOC110639020 isoform X2 n=1 Tax=Hevea brasiliensis TaxID=3981 RepID=UPI000B781424|nr:uncharacterized protein LOC110639020 isoform X2 [Hevea brasiliensis]
MAAFTNCSFSSATSLSNPTFNIKPHQPINSLSCTNFFKPISSSNSYPSFSLPRQKTSRSKLALSKRAYRLVEVAALVDDNSETYPEAEPSYSNTDATIDIELPRRSLLVQFTCNECGERTQRLINRLAYERGLVYVQDVSGITN